MKKVTVAIFCLMFLCGCTGNVQPEDQIVITAIGVDSQEENIVITLEASRLNSSSEQETKTNIYKADGKNVISAINSIKKEADGQLLLSQCPVILIDKDLPSAVKNDIFDFCLYEYDVSLSIRLISCENAAKIIEAAEESVGFTVLKMTEFGDENLGIAQNDTLCEIIERQEDVNCYKLPYIEQNKGKLSINGFSLFDNGDFFRNTTLLDAQLINILNCDFKKGYLDIGGSVINVKKVKVKTENQQENTQLRLDFYIKGETDENTKSAIFTAVKSLLEKDYTTDYITNDKLKNKNITDINIRLIGESI